MSAVITRFAPSPTGFLHIGSMRTALINYLFIQNSKIENKDSKFLLRIEDTDKKRSDDRYLKSIIDGLNWLQIKWDGDIYKQSDNINLHLKVANDLLTNKKAFKCLCTKEELENKRKIYLSKGMSIKRLCSSCENNNEIQSSKNNFCIRIKIDESNYTQIEDEILGNIKILNNEIDNFILVRNDGTPTYMLSVVVDDHFMGITHIIRGDDHLNNAFRQFHLYKNLNWKIPKFAHIPLIHGHDGKKLSKRHGSTNINEFKKEGYLPIAIINYLMKLGITTIEDEFFTTSIISKIFSLKSVVKSSSRFDYDKLKFINSHYLGNLDNDLLINKLKDEHNLLFTNNELINKIITIYKRRSKTLIELKNFILSYSESNNIEYNNLNFSKETIELIKKFYNLIEIEKNWSYQNTELIIKEFIKKNKIKFVNLGEPMRLILTGSSKGPSLSDIFYILGKKNILKKINDFLIQLNSVI